MICLDEMGPVSAKSYAGHALVSTKTRPAGRAKQEIDYGRRAKGYIFGAFCPATGEAFTHPYPGRGGAHWVDFLEHVETWIRLIGQAQAYYQLLMSTLSRELSLPSAIHSPI